MDQRRFDAGGYTIAAIAAPGIAMAVFLLVGLGLADLPAPGDIFRLIGSLLLLLLIVSLWGALPSLVFGGLVLAVIQQIPWRKRPGAAVFMTGGAVAAGLYVLTGLGVAGLSPGAALVFAPWATPDLWGPNAGAEDWWLVASLLLAGASAGSMRGSPRGADKAVSRVYMPPHIVRPASNGAV